MEQLDNTFPTHKNLSLTNLDLDLLGEVGDAVEHLDALLDALVDDGEVVLRLLSHRLRLRRVRVPQVLEVVDGVHAVLQKNHGYIVVDGVHAVLQKNHGFIVSTSGVSHLQCDTTAQPTRRLNVLSSFAFRVNWVLFDVFFFFLMVSFARCALRLCI